MPVTMEQVLDILGAEEPAYPRVVQLGPDTVPHLAVLAEGRDISLAAKAVYLASLIPGAESAALVENAAGHPNVIVRIAAASGLRNLEAPEAARVGARTLEDEDLSVRKVSLQSIATSCSPVLRQLIEERLKVEQEPFLRELAAETLKRIP